MEGKGEGERKREEGEGERVREQFKDISTIPKLPDIDEQGYWVIQYALLEHVGSNHREVYLLKLIKK